MNTYVIGDIHGNSKALKQVLKRAPITKKDRLIFLGDYGDGHENTSEVVDILIGLKNVGFETIFCLGNHDTWVKTWLNSGTRQPVWEMQGGKATIQSYIKSGKLIDEDHLYFWNTLKPYYIDEKNRLYLHGGWNGQESFTKICTKEMMKGHPEITWNRTLAESYFEPTDHTEKFNEIFIGHTATQDHKPKNNWNIWNLDTGAGWAGKLTIMNVDTHEYWQSDKNLKSPR